MNKAELIAAVADRTETTKASAEAAVNAVFGVITDELATGSGEVKVAGFGNFSKKHKAARTGRNPQTGEAVEIAARNAAGFSAAKGLKDSINS
ncbi:MAG: HU family DNA-binding protein [Aestuariibacter sp.]|nr:HU family DNA-binding protein [Aestuariibacter sp.]|tara:strand:- start:277274 stop:277552 length:279 start_codon:yes stop_codon:yes gene_type:complete